MATVLVIQWADREVPEVWSWPGEKVPTREAARLQAVARAQDRPDIGVEVWLFVRKCGTRRMTLEMET